MYYIFITVAAACFSFQFFFNKLYQKEEGTLLPSALLFTLLTSAVKCLTMACAGGLQLQLTSFSLILSLLCAANGILLNVCSVRALRYANLSLFSMYTMLGGMLLPFFAGILFWQEPLTPRKILCCALMIAALALTVEKGGRKAGAGKYYLLVFLFNGINSVLSKVHQSSPQAVSSESYLFWSSLFAAVICGILLVFAGRGSLRLQNPRKSLGNSVGFALLNGFGNLLLLIALQHVEASVQYPFVTGGAIVVSTILARCTREHPGKRAIAAVGVAFLATLLLL